ncbi:MAG TPA: ribosomal protein S18-alanine N-acetyltransferase [Nitrospiria bacterium]|jgi:ribosomal-protein-alanine N-acetyltransferase
MRVPQENKTSLQVKPMKPEDLDQILDIEQRSYTEPWIREMFLDELFEKWFSHSVVLRLSPSSDPLGYSCFWILESELHLLNLTIDPAWQGRGFGTRLLQWILAGGKKQKALNAFLEVRVSNQGAIRLYEKNGFQQLTQRKNYYSNPQEDALILKYSYDPIFF